MRKHLDRYAELVYAMLRIVVAFMYACHGTQKLFAWPIGIGGRVGETAQVLSLIGAAGVIEFVGGTMIMVGFCGDWAAFICSGEMAVAYVLRQVPISPLPIIARGILGESAVFNCLFFLYVAAKGSGMLSIDALLERRVLPANR